MNVSKQSLIATILSFLILPLCLSLLHVNGLLILNVMLWILVIILCSSRFNDNIFFVAFLFSFFIFLISGDLAEEIFGIYYYRRFDSDAIIHAHISIAISLVFLFAGFSIKSHRRNFKVKLVRSIDTLSDDSKEVYIRCLRCISKYIFLATFAILFIDTVYKAYYVSIHGYISYYTTYRSFLPTIVVEIGEFAPVAFCVFLATFPSKKECKPILVLYILYAVIGIIVGQRGAFIYNTVFVIAYLFYRNKHYNNGEVWMKKGYVILMICAFPFLLVALFLYGYVRVGNDIVYTSFSETLIKFFVNIGSSSQIIKDGFVHRNQLTDFKFYSLGGILNYFKYGRLFNLFSSSSIPAAHTAQYALEGHSFTEMISYLSMTSGYLSGEGAGSCFIAELFADFGYIGIAIGSAIYGFFFKSLAVMKKENWLSTTLKLYMMLNMLKAPRGPYDDFLASIININFILLIIFIYFATETLYGRTRGNNIMGKSSEKTC